MEEHVEKDEIISMKDYNKTEKVLNAHGTSLLRILGLRVYFGKEGQMKESITVQNSHRPDLYGLRKDHKEEDVSEENCEEIGGAIDPANCGT